MSPEEDGLAGWPEVIFKIQEVSLRTIFPIIDGESDARCKRGKRSPRAAECTEDRYTMPLTRASGSPCNLERGVGPAQDVSTLHDPPVSLLNGHSCFLTGGNWAACCFGGMWRGGAPGRSHRRGERVLQERGRCEGRRRYIGKPSPKAGL